MSGSASPTTASRNLLGWVIGIAALLVLVLLVCLLMWSISGVSGSEFAPSHFQSQDFAFSAVPLIGWQIQGITRTSTTDSTSRYLIANKLINVPADPPVRWDLVRINKAFGSLYDADPSFLTAFLQGRGGSGVDWEQWSKDHAPAAAVLWPFVQQMAVDRLYLMIPRVFELAENETDPAKLKADLDAYLSNALPSFAEDLFNAGYEQQALSALQSAVVQYPQQEAFSDTLARLMPKE